MRQLPESNKGVSINYSIFLFVHMNLSLQPPTIDLGEHIRDDENTQGDYGLQEEGYMSKLLLIPNLVFIPKTTKLLSLIPLKDGWSICLVTNILLSLLMYSIANLKCPTKAQFFSPYCYCIHVFKTGTFPWCTSNQREPSQLRCRSWVVTWADCNCHRWHAFCE